MKQIAFILLLIIGIISCTGEPYVRNAIGMDIGHGFFDKTSGAGKKYPNLVPAKGDSTLQISIFIRQMYQDKAGILWLGTYGMGIARYDGKSMKYLNTENGLSGSIVRGITEDEKGNLWFATNGGISRYDGKHLFNFTVNQGLASNQVWCILRDNKGTIWAGTEAGVSRFDGKKFVNFPITDIPFETKYGAYPAPGLVTSIFQDKSGNIWFGTNGGGIYRYNGKTLTPFTEKEGLSSNFIQSIYEDKEGQLWFSTRFGGVSIYDGKQFVNLKDHNGLRTNFVWSVMEDKNGDMWLATGGNGVIRCKGTSTSTCFGQYYYYKNEDGLSDNFVQSILQDHDGNMWFGTGMGISRYDGKEFFTYPLKRGDGC